MKSAVIALVTAFAVNACTKHTPIPSPVTNNTPIIDSNRVPVTGTNVAPVAYAGEDEIITVSTGSFDLHGNGIDSDGKIVRYQWYIAAYHARTGQYEYFDFQNPSVTISDIAAGTYTCTLIITDDMGASARDELIVEVRPD